MKQESHGLDKDKGQHQIVNLEDSFFPDNKKKYETINEHEMTMNIINLFFNVDSIVIM